MEHKSVKFDWNGVEEENKGHNKNEWGNTEENQKQKPTVIHSYKVKWETDD